MTIRAVAPPTIPHPNDVTLTLLPMGCPATSWNLVQECSWHPAVVRFADAGTSGVGRPEREDDRGPQGHALDGIDVQGFSALKTFETDPKDLLGVAWRGPRAAALPRYVAISVPDPVHLSQGGRVDIESPPKSSQAPRIGGAVSIRRRSFDPDQRFGTERKAAWWVLRAGEDGPLEKLGPEPFDPAFEQLVMNGTDGRQLHTFLRDQRTVAGIGRGPPTTSSTPRCCHPSRSLQQRRPRRRGAAGSVEIRPTRC